MDFEHLPSRRMFLYTPFGGTFEILNWEPSQKFEQVHNSEFQQVNNAGIHFSRESHCSHIGMSHHKPIVCVQQICHFCSKGQWPVLSSIHSISC